MRNPHSLLLSLVMSLAFVFTVSSGAVAADKEAPAKADKAQKAEKAHKGKEVTLKGDLGCGKCSFKTTKECQNVLKVTDGGKETMYYLADNSVSKDHHDAV